jgi:hypothetical protein
MWPRRAKSEVLLAVAGVSLYLLLPSLLAVFICGSLSNLDWCFAVLVLVCEVASFVCLWELDRIALRTRAWLPVAAAQLSGNAVGRILPGGGARATAFTASMLHRAGADTGEAAAAFGASTGLQIATRWRCRYSRCRKREDGCGVSARAQPPRRFPQAPQTATVRMSIAQPGGNCP